jgi:hypothetical protein
MYHATEEFTSKLSLTCLPKLNYKADQYDMPA